VEYESGGSVDDDYHHQVAMQQHMEGPHKNMPPIYTQQMPYPDHAGVYHPVSYGDPSSSHGQPAMHYSNMQTPMQTPVSVVDQHQNYPTQPVYPSVPLQQQSAHPHSPETYEQDQYGQQNLADLLGNLRVNEAGSGRSHSVLQKYSEVTHVMQHRTLTRRPRPCWKSQRLKMTMITSMRCHPRYVVRISRSGYQ
jgi:hypothetical protein